MGIKFTFSRYTKYSAINLKKIYSISSTMKKLKLILITMNTSSDGSRSRFGGGESVSYEMTLFLLYFFVFRAGNRQVHLYQTTFFFWAGGGIYSIPPDPPLIRVILAQTKKRCTFNIGKNCRVTNYSLSVDILSRYKF